MDTVFYIGVYLNKKSLLICTLAGGLFNCFSLLYADAVF